MEDSWILGMVLDSFKDILLSWCRPFPSKIVPHEVILLHMINPLSKLRISILPVIMHPHLGLEQESTGVLITLEIEVMAEVGAQLGVAAVVVEEAIFKALFKKFEELIKKH